MRLELSAGAWVELSDSKVVTERLRRPIREAMQGFSPQLRQFFNTYRDAEADGYAEAMAEAVSPDDTKAMLFINDFIACAVVDSASFVPAGEKCTIDHFLDLPAHVYDAILLAVSPRVGDFMNGVNFEPSPDPASPTPPSNA